MTPKDSVGDCAPSNIPGLKPNSRMDELLYSAVCLLSGILAVFVFYQMTFSFVALKHIWPGQVFSDVLGGSEYITATVVSVFMLPHNGIRLELFHISCAIYLMTGIAFPLIVTFLPGMENFQTARILLIAISIFTGVADGLMSIVGYGLSAIVPRSRVPLRAAGCALAGSLPFFIFLFLSEAIFEKTKDGQKLLIWLFMPCGVLFSVPLLSCLTILQRREWFNELIESAKEQHEAQFTPERSRYRQTFACCPTPSKNPYDSESTPLDGSIMDLKGVLKASRLPVSCLSLSFIVFGMLFPIVAPYQFGQTYAWNTILNGFGQIAHTLMRFATVYFPFLHIRPKWLLLVIMIRGLFFFPLFIIIARFPNILLLRSTSFLTFCMIIFNGSHGWAVTLSCKHIVQSVSNLQEKAIASKITTIATFFCLGIAQFAGKLTTL